MTTTARQTHSIEISFTNELGQAVTVITCPVAGASLIAAQVVRTATSRRGHTNTWTEAVCPLCDQH